MWPLRAVSIPAYLVIGRAHLPEPCAQGPSQTPSAQGLQGTLGLHDTHVVGLSSVHAHALPPHQTSLTKYKFKCQTQQMSTHINVREFQGVDRRALSHRSSSECGSLSIRTGYTLMKEACASGTPVSCACGPVSWIHLIEFVSGLLFVGSEKINWVEPLLSAFAQACCPGGLSSPVAEGSCHSFGKPGFWMGSRQSAPGPFINSRRHSRACSNQALNRAAFLVGCVGFRIRDVIENIFGQRLRV